MKPLRPAVAVLIGALSAAVAFALAFAMVMSRQAPSAAAPASKSVILSTTVDGVSALVTISDPTGQNTVLLSLDTDSDGTWKQKTQNISRTVPAGGSITISVAPVMLSTGFENTATTSCAIYTDDNGTQGQQLVGRQSIGLAANVTTPPTVCTWTNQ